MDQIDGAAPSSHSVPYPGRIRLVDALQFWFWPSGPRGVRASLDISQNRLPARLDIDILGSHFLLSFATVLVEDRQLLGLEDHELLGMSQRHITPYERLLGQDSSLQAIWRRKVGSDLLRGKHTLRTLLRR